MMEKKKFQILIIFTILIFYISEQIECNKIKPKIAIIGSGIGGSSLVHYLNTVFTDVEIELFEQDNRIGGRTHTIDFNDKKKELGAHFIIKENKNIADLALEYNIYLDYPNHDSIGIVKNNKIEYQMPNSSYQFMNYFSMGWRYGWSLYKLYSQCKSDLQKFQQIYQHLDWNEPKPYENYYEFMDKIEQKDKFNKTTSDLYIEDYGISELVTEELIQSAIMDFFNQNLNINSIAGMVCASGAMSEAYIAREGINSFSEKILKFAQKNHQTKVYINTKVEEIAKNMNDHKYTLYYKNINNEDEKLENQQNNTELLSSEYDLVIIATPLEIADIKFTNIELNPVNTIKRKYKPIHKYVVAAKRIRNKNLTAERTGEELKCLITPDRIYKKISFLYKSCSNCTENKSRNQYEFASNNTLNQKDLNQLFVQPKIIFYKQIDFPYPDLFHSMHRPLPEIILNPGLYYNNGMEFIASCIEMQAINAQNIVNLIRQKEGKNWAENDLRVNAQDL